MKNKILKHPLITTIILSLLISGYMLYPIVVNNQGVMIYYSDSLEQQYEFLLGFWQIFHDGNFGFWQWSLGLGATQLSYVFYNFLSPFNLLILPLSKDMIQHALGILMILKFVALSMTSYLWFSTISKNKIVSIMLSLFLTYCGWNIVYLHYNFIDAFIFYPLILYYVENYLQNDKKLGLILSISYLTFMNYYFMYMLVPFICLYWLCRKVSLQTRINMRKIFVSGIKYVSLVLLSIGTSAFILLPCMFQVLQTPRLSNETTNLWSTITQFDIFKGISSLITPTMGIHQTNLFITNDKLTYMGWGGGASLYISILCVFLVVYFCITKWNKEKVSLACMGGVLALFYVFPIAYKILQGTIDTRWYYMIVFYLLMLMSDALNLIMDDDLDKKRAFVSMALTFLFSIAIYYIARIKYFNTLDQINLQMHVTLRLFVILILYVGLLSLKRKRSILLLLVCMIDIGYSSSIFTNNVLPIDVENMRKYQSEVNETLQALKNDQSFYRLLYSQEESSLANQPYADQIPGNSFYLSLYAFEQEEFLENMKSTWSMQQNKGLYNLRNKLGNKYLYVNEDQFIPYGYVESDDLAGIYVNQLTTGLGYFSNKTINSSFVNEQHALLKDYLLSKYITTEHSDNFDYVDTRVYVEIQNYVKNEYMEIWLENPIEDALIIYESGGVPKYNVQYFYKDELVNEIDYWQYHYAESYIPKEVWVDKIVIRMDDVDNTGQGIRVFMQEDFSDFIEKTYNERKETMLFDTLNLGDKIYAKANIDEDMTLFTSIPYSEGWKCFANGEQMETIKVNLGFVGSELKAGAYELEFVYQPPWMKEGIILSGVSIIILALVIQRKII